MLERNLVDQIAKSPVRQWKLEVDMLAILAATAAKTPPPTDIR
ncbi:hypothetical protein ACFW1P_13865 [Paenibacillus sp. NPDC058910]